MTQNYISKPCPTIIGGPSVEGINYLIYQFVLGPPPIPNFLLTKVYICYVIGCIKLHGPNDCIGFLRNSLHLSSQLVKCNNGPIDQLGRSPPWHGGGREFKSRSVHFQFFLFMLAALGHPPKRKRRINKKNSGDPARSLITGDCETPGKLSKTSQRSKCPSELWIPIKIPTGPLPLF